MLSRLTIIALLAGTACAGAHVTLAVPDAKTSSRFVASFRIGHGCSGAATTALRIDIPPGIASARPLALAGWTLALEHQGERVSAVTWSGGEIPAEAYGEFSLLVKTPDAPATIAFPVTQSCGKTVEHWSGADADHPAPVLSVSAAGGAAAAPAPAASSAPPRASVSDAWFRALPAGRPAGGYFTLHNDGAGTLVLTGASSPACANLMLHKSENSNGVAGMRDVDKVEIAPGAALSFAEGGYHLMCMEPRPEMKPGGAVDVTLEFQGGTLKSAFAVKDAAGK